MPSVCGDVARVVDRVERAAGPVGNVVAVAEQLHRGADDVVALLDEQRRGHGAVDSARHRDEHALTSRPSAPASFRTFATTFGITSATRSTSARQLSWPRLNRMRAERKVVGDAHRAQHVGRLDGARRARRSAGAATPARSRCMSSASLSVPGTATLETWGARSAPSAFITTSGTPARRRARGRRASAQALGLRACSATASSAARPKRDGARHVLGARPDAVLLAAAVDDRLDRLAGRARSARRCPWRADLVAGDGQQGATARRAGVIGTLPNAWTASVWNVTPAAAQRAAISATGCTTPTSLFTHITDTTAGRSRQRLRPAPRVHPSLAVHGEQDLRRRDDTRRGRPRESPCARWPRRPRTWPRPGPARRAPRPRCRDCRPRCRRR